MPYPLPAPHYTWFSLLQLCSEHTGGIQVLSLENTCPSQVALLSSSVLPAFQVFGLQLLLPFIDLLL